MPSGPAAGAGGVLAAGDGVGDVLGWFRGLVQSRLARREAQAVLSNTQVDCEDVTVSTREIHMMICDAKIVGS